MEWLLLFSRYLVIVTLCGICGIAIGMTTFAYMWPLWNEYWIHQWLIGDDLDARYHGLSPEVLIMIPKWEHQGGSDVHKCAVCLQEIMDGHLYRRLPGCTHCFHASCIDRWLMESSTCPLCQTQVHLSYQIV